MKKILILTSRYDKRKKKLIKNISQLFHGQADVKLDFLENFASIISKNKLQGYISGIRLSAFNFVYFSGKKAFLTAPKAIAMCLQSSSIPFLGYTSYTGNKLTSISKLAQDNIAIPDTVFCSASSTNQADLDFIKKLGFPIIIKKLNVHQTKGIYVVKTEEELKKFLVKHPDEQFLFQKFINIYQEYRILVIGGKATSAHTKVLRSYKAKKVGYINPNEEYKFIDLKSLPKRLITEAEKAARALSLDIAGVDVCTNKEGGVYVFEANRDPGIGSEKDSPEILGLVKYFSKALFT